MVSNQYLCIIKQLFPKRISYPYTSLSSSCNAFVILIVKTVFITILFITFCVSWLGLLTIAFILSVVSYPNFLMTTSLSKILICCSFLPSAEKPYYLISTKVSKKDLLKFLTFIVLLFKHCLKLR